MDNDDTSVMFEVGVAEHPQTKARLDALTNKVLEAQAKMTQGVERVGTAAQSVMGAVEPLANMMQRVSASSVSGLDSVRQAVSRLQSVVDINSEKIIQVVVKGAEALDEKSEAKTEKVVEVVVQGSDALAKLQALTEGKSEKVVEVVVNGAESLSKLQTASETSQKVVEVVVKGSDSIAQDLNAGFERAKDSAKDAVDGITSEFESLPANIRGVFDRLGSDIDGKAQEIEAAFNESISKLPQSVAANSQLIKQEYQKRVKDQATAYSQMAEDLDSAIENHPDELPIFSLVGRTFKRTVKSTSDPANLK